MLTKTIIGAVLSSATSTAVVTNETTPNLPGTSAVRLTEYTSNATMKVKVEGSDDNSTWSDLWDPADVDMAGVNALHQIRPTVTLPKYIKGTVTAYTDGSVSFHIMNAG